MVTRLVHPKKAASFETALFDALDKQNYLDDLLSLSVFISCPSLSKKRKM